MVGVVYFLGCFFVNKSMQFMVSSRQPTPTMDIVMGGMKLCCSSCHRRMVGSAWQKRERFARENFSFSVTSQQSNRITLTSSNTICMLAVCAVYVQRCHAKRTQNTLHLSFTSLGGEEKECESERMDGRKICVESILTEEHAFIYMYRNSPSDKRDSFYMSMRIWWISDYVWKCKENRIESNPSAGSFDVQKTNKNTHSTFGMLLILLLWFHKTNESKDITLFTWIVRVKAF